MSSWMVKLACPQCRLPLVREGELLRCQGCQAGFRERSGVVDFLREDSAERRRLEGRDGRAMVQNYRAPNRALKWARRLITSEYFPGKAWRRAKQRALNGKPCLIIGSGVTHYPDAIHLDIDDFPGVDIVAAAQALPFASDSLGGAICEVVLEHVAQPQIVIDEVFRVLAPGGRFFATVPFVFPYHGHPSDFRRWSRSGLQTIFDDFDEVEVGIHGGPCSGLVNLISEWIYIVSGFSFPTGYTLIKGGVTALLFPLKFLDLLVNRFPEAHRMAATLYVTGVKPTVSSRRA